MLTFFFLFRDSLVSNFYVTCLKSFFYLFRFCIESESINILQDKKKEKSYYRFSCSCLFQNFWSGKKIKVGNIHLDRKQRKYFLFPLHTCVWLRFWTFIFKSDEILLKIWSFNIFACSNQFLGLSLTKLQVFCPSKIHVQT